MVICEPDTPLLVEDEHFLFFFVGMKLPFFWLALQRISKSQNYEKDPVILI